MLIAVLIVLVVVALAAAALIAREVRSRNIAVWLGGYLRQDWRARAGTAGPRHLMFCFVDHYEPGWGKPGYEIECARVARWRRDLPTLCASHRDADGRAPVHSFFYPEEEYRVEHLDALVDLCRMGLGEIEIHLHHDRDNEANLRATLQRFTEMLEAADGRGEFRPRNDVEAWYWDVMDRANR